MRIETERLILRPWQAGDEHALWTLTSAPDVRRFYPMCLTREEAAATLSRALTAQRQRGFHFLAAQLRETGAFAGLLGLAYIPQATRDVIPGNPEVEIGWQLKSQFWGAGLAPEGAMACLKYGWKTLGLSEVVAFTAAINTPSRRVMEKIGMTHDPADNFEHPNVPENHALRAHVLYRIASPGR